jgi:hypothetical protein
MADALADARLAEIGRTTARVRVETDKLTAMYG